MVDMCAGWPGAGVTELGQQHNTMPISCAYHVTARWAAPLLIALPIGGAPTSGEETFVNPTDGSEMVFVEEGKFKMGYRHGQDDRPAHDVHTEAFYISKHEITNRQWQQFVAANVQWQKERIKRQAHNGHYLRHWEGGSFGPAQAEHPVVYVSWLAAKAYCEWAGGRLPTEAEWEKACRAGSLAKWCVGDDQKLLDEYAWNRENAGWRTHPVGQKKPNAWGLYDVHGNVWEWTSSIYRPYWYRADDGREDQQDLTSHRTMRGGSWGVNAQLCRAAFRFHGKPSYCNAGTGLRLCIPAAARK